MGVTGWRTLRVLHVILFLYIGNLFLHKELRDFTVYRAEVSSNQGIKSSVRTEISEGRWGGTGVGGDPGNWGGGGRIRQHFVQGSFVSKVVILVQAVPWGSHRSAAHWGTAVNLESRCSSGQPQSRWSRVRFSQHSWILVDAAQIKHLSTLKCSGKQNFNQPAISFIVQRWKEGKSTPLQV